MLVDSRERCHVKPPAKSRVFINPHSPLALFFATSLSQFTVVVTSDKKKRAIIATGCDFSSMQGLDALMLCRTSGDRLLKHLAAQDGNARTHGVGRQKISVLHTKSTSYCVCHGLAIFLGTCRTHANQFGENIIGPSSNSRCMPRK